jgi:hypothetical protein
MEPGTEPTLSPAPYVAPYPALASVCTVYTVLMGLTVLMEPGTEPGMEPVAEPAPSLAPYPAPYQVLASLGLYAFSFKKNPISAQYLWILLYLWS